jgi:uncharacterized protein YbbC (DUF1343 family)
MSTKSAISAGIDEFINQKGSYTAYRLGLITNDAAQTTRQELSRIALLKNGFNVIKLFSPEHGISSLGEDGVYQKDQLDALTGLPVISLYANKLMPDANDLAAIDLLVFDLPDIGCRFYTYQWTLSYIMEACAIYNKPLVVLDRPNPLSGNLSMAEGPLLDEAHCSSFIGRWSIPLRHSLTMGELALYWNQQRRMNLEITVIPVKGWQRNYFYDDLTIPFVPTSPAITDFSTALLYPGTGLLEGVNISEGRGTSQPFKIGGAPFINGEILSEQFNQLNLPGVHVKPASFIPLWSKYANELCKGIELVVTDKHNFKPVRTGLSLLNCLMNLYPHEVKPHLYKTVANPSGADHLDKLTGIANTWLLLHQPVNKFHQQLSSITSIQNWKEQVQPYLLY